MQLVEHTPAEPSFFQPAQAGRRRLSGAARRQCGSHSCAAMRSVRCTRCCAAAARSTATPSSRRVLGLLNVFILLAERSQAKTMDTAALGAPACPKRIEPGSTTCVLGLQTQAPHMLLCSYESGQLPAQLQTPELSQWAKLPSRAEREAAPLSAEAASAAADTYFQLYTQRFGEEGVRDALACIPQVYSHCVGHLVRKRCARLLAGKTGCRLRTRLCLQSELPNNFPQNHSKQCLLLQGMTAARQ